MCLDKMLRITMVIEKASTNKVMSDKRAKPEGTGDKKKGETKFSSYRNHKKGNQLKSQEKKDVSNEDHEKKLKRAQRFQQTDSNKTTSKSYGFISRGESSALQHSRKEREKYFETIIDNFTKYCEGNSSSSLSQEFRKYIDREGEKDKKDNKLHENEHENDSKSQKENHSLHNTNTSIDSILLSLRKLREALINIPIDDFTIKAFLLSIRIAANVGHYQTYVPAINFLLAHKRHLETQEEHEISTLLVIHIVHFNNDYHKAINLYFKHFTNNGSTKLLTIIQSWFLNDYYNWVKLYNSEVDNARSRIMSFGVKSIISTIISTLELAYFNIDCNYLNQKILPNGVDLSILQKSYGVKWVTKDNNVVIRERRKR